jgi:hypothetical protein
MEHINTLCEQNKGISYSVKSGGTRINHRALNGYVQLQLSVKDKAKTSVRSKFKQSYTPGQSCFNFSSNGHLGEISAAESYLGTTHTEDVWGEYLDLRWRKEHEDLYYLHC